MDQSWYRRLFALPQRTNAPRTKAQAAAGDRDAQYALGMTYACGTGELRDPGMALLWLRRAAEQDHVLAQFNLGTLYAEGEGVTRDPVEATFWMERAASHGDPGAQFNLGVGCQRASYRSTREHGSEARIEAYKWFELASRQGYVNAAASSERLNLDMSREELAEGHRRIAATAVSPPPASATPAG